MPAHSVRPGATMPVMDAPLRLDANEGRCILSAEVLAGLLSPETARRYPDALPLERDLAAGFGLDESLVIATAGADDAIDRAVRMIAGPGSVIATTNPSFGEYADAAARSGATCLSVERLPEGPFPLGEICILLREEAPAMLLIASPDNPGGGVVTEEEFEVLASACAQAGTTLFLDLTYDDFTSDRRLRERALATPGVVVAGSFSKSHGLAGFRVGWAAACAESAALIKILRRAGPPFSLASPAIAAAQAALAADSEISETFFAQVRSERLRLREKLASMGAQTWPGEANFVCVRVEDAIGLTRKLNEGGIMIRSWPGKPGSENLVRISCPGDEAEFLRLISALDEIGGV